MPLAYVPQSTGRGATSGPVKFYKPNIIRAGTRYGGIVQGAYQAGRYLYRHYKAVTGISSIGIGAGLSGIDLNENAPNNKYSQALRTTRKRSNRNRRYKVNGQHCRCQPRCC